MSKSKYIVYNSKYSKTKNQIFLKITPFDYVGILKFPIMINVIESINDDESIGNVFEVENEFFNLFPVGSEFILRETFDTAASYKIRIIDFDNHNTVFKLIDIYRTEGESWLYDNKIQYLTDWGVIKYAGSAYIKS